MHGLYQAAAALLLVGGVVRAQQDTADSNDPPVKYLSLDRLDAYLEFEADFSQTRVAQKGLGIGGSRAAQTNRNWLIEERLGFTLSGHVIDPGFINFGGDVAFALTQTRNSEHSPFGKITDNDSGVLLTYDMRVNFFQGRPLSASVYGLRQDDRIPRRFQPTLDERRTGFGGNWVYATDDLTMTLAYDYLRTERSGNANALDNETFTDSTLRYDLDWRISDHERFKFAYEHAKEKQDFQGSFRSFNTTRDLFTIEHELGFGPNYRHTLRTLVHWQEESGDLARDLFEIGPQVTLKHSDNLQTMYKYQFNRERYSGLDIETHRGDLQLVHQLYNNLTTTIDIFGLHEAVADDVITNQWGAGINWQYNRRNPYGHLYANLAIAYDTEDVRGDNGTRVILDEAATLRDPLPVVLRNRDVLQGTIVVTDTTNRRVFLLGVDYLVLRRGTATLLARVRGGDIADNDSVLVDYLIETPADGQTDTIRVDFNIEQRFTNGLTPYYRLSFRDQDVDFSTGFAREADRTDHHRIGAKYEGKRFTLGAEYEIFDDTIDPYYGFHLDGMWRMIDGPQRSLGSSARFSRLFFEGGIDDRNVTLLDLEIDHRLRLSDRLSVVQRLLYRWEDDSVAGDTHGWDVVAGLNYRVGDLSAELTFEYDRLDLPGSEQDDYGVYVRIRRDIPNILAR